MKACSSTASLRGCQRFRRSTNSSVATKPETLMPSQSGAWLAAVHPYVAMATTPIVASREIQPQKTMNADPPTSIA